MVYKEDRSVQESRRSQLHMDRAEQTERRRQHIIRKEIHTRRFSQERRASGRQSEIRQSSVRQLSDRERLHDHFGNKGD